jgi:putative ABC transport system permease protein
MRPLTGTLAERLRNDPSVVSASASHSIPSSFLNGFSYIPEGGTRDDRVSLGNVAVDFDFLKTIDVELAAGRLFDRSLVGDSTAFVLNESAVAELGWSSPDDALGRRLEWPLGSLGFSGPVIGVIRDFNFGSLHDEIPPIAFNVTRFGVNHLVFRVRPGARDDALTLVRNTWTQVEGDLPFEYRTMTELIAAQYETERRLTRLFTWTAMIALLISCLGLFSLASYTTQRRTREIGIRKTLGASSGGIVFLLSRQFLLDVIIAVGVASPVAWLLMDRWLQSFAYRTGIGPMPFILSGLIAAGIACVAVSSQAFRAASADPVRSLRTD